MVDVYFQHCHYDDPDLRQTVFQMMDAMGGHSIRSDSSIIIKPNLLLPADPDWAVNTHPMIVRHVAEYVIDKGFRPVISDSPPASSFEQILSKGGYVQALAGLDVVFRPFRESTKIDIGEPFGTIELAREVLEADYVINLAKLKTHAHMSLSLGVQNMFGCVVGLRKSEWHLKAGMDRNLFARLLVQINAAVRPAMTIIDGILALEGMGPGLRGTPRELNLLVGSRDALAADMAVCNVVGLDLSAMWAYSAARQLKMLPDKIHVRGPFHVLDDLKLAHMETMKTGPEMFNGFMRKHVRQKPVCNNQQCKLCGDCWRYCPVKAIDHHIKGIRYNYNACIRCYCCLEICPYGAITIKEPLSGKILERMGTL